MRLKDSDLEDILHCAVNEDFDHSKLIEKLVLEIKDLRKVLSIYHDWHPDLKMRLIKTETKNQIR